MNDLAPRPAASQPLSPADATSSLTRTLEARTERIAPALYRYRPGQGPSEPERRAARDLADRLNAMLARRLSATDPKIEAAVEQLFANFKVKRQLPDPAAQASSDALAADGFMIALGGRCAPALTQAVRMMLEGAAGLSRTFVPTCAEVAHLVDSVEADWRFKLDRLATVLGYHESEPDEPEELDEEAREARRVRTRELVQRLRGSNPSASGRDMAADTVPATGRVAGRHRIAGGPGGAVSPAGRVAAGITARGAVGFSSPSEGGSN